MFFEKTYAIKNNIISTFKILVYCCYLRESEKKHPMRSWFAFIAVLLLHIVALVVHTL